MIATTQPPPRVDDVGDAVNVPWERIEQFVGQLTHDVRNGLNALELQLTFLGEISTDPEAVDEVKRLRKSLADLTRELQAVKVSTGPVTLNTLPYPATDFLEDLRERFERGEPQDAARVTWHIPATAAVLAIDPELLMAALLAIIGNALRFAPPASPIVLSVAASERKVVITVQQELAETPTIPLEQWGRAPLLSTHRGGYGLGLFRARRIIESQAGTLAASHSAADRALVMTVTFPVAS